MSSPATSAQLKPDAPFSLDLLAVSYTHLAQRRADPHCRLGQALGLRHADVVSRDRQIRIVPRADNANGARAKTSAIHLIPVTTALVRLYSEYLHSEYGDLDSDYVFVNLWSEPRGHALTYSAVADLIVRLRARTGIFFTLHMLRHYVDGWVMWPAGVFAVVGVSRGSVPAT